MGGGSGSPLLARTQVNIFLVIALLMGIIAVLTFIYLVSKIIGNYRKSPQYLEKKRLRPSSTSDVNEVARFSHLTKDERDLLYRACKDNPSPNILYAVQDLSYISGILKDLFEQLDAEDDEKAKTALFSLRTKLFRSYTPPEEMTSSRKIDVGTKMTYTASHGVHYRLQYVERTPDALIINLPQNIIERNDRPAPLSKISLIFEAASGAPYQMETRVVRYQQNGRNEDQMVVMHSEQITPLQRRQVERIEMHEACAFASVTVSTMQDGKENRIVYKPSATMHKGLLLDVSAGGCRLVTNIPIKAEQFIYISGKLNTKNEDSAIGTILRTTKREDGNFILHIKFVKIEPPVVNRIQAVAIGYA
ncbi:MAG: PilZ domain-containing protein [Treponema sp.]|nr:PilZ domain-containing protein [Treponema sp.]